MKKILLLFISLLIVVSSCKKKEEENKVDNTQILGKRYPDGNVFITSVPGSTKKQDRVALVYDLEEVTGLEIKSEGNKEYLKLKTVTGKEGYAPLDRFVEVVYFAVGDGITAFLKPTLTAPTKGKMDKGALCYIKETLSEWGRATCYSAKLTFGEVPETYYNVWIQLSDPGLSKDPMLGQTALTIRNATKVIAKAMKTENPEEAAKLRKEAKETLNKAIEKEDVFKAYAQELLAKLEPLEGGQKKEETNNPAPGSEGKETPPETKTRDMDTPVETKPEG
ncbi:MAG: lipoprotein LenA [Leptospiraceae bacterium]|nr:lipoprotein LenA [Leptospiraceae bacterium]MCP5500722.1 lipoprotein LenA [Leptospiraceae bacterium]